MGTKAHQRGFELVNFFRVELAACDRARVVSLGFLCEEK